MEEPGGSEINTELHQAVFNNDLKTVSVLLRSARERNIDIGGRDVPGGNTALHLAVMLGRRECVQLLLAHGAPVKLKNTAGWSPLAEAISYGERQTIASLLRRLKQQAKV